MVGWRLTHPTRKTTFLFGPLASAATLPSWHLGSPHLLLSPNQSLLSQARSQLGHCLSAPSLLGKFLIFVWLLAFQRSQRRIRIPKHPTILGSQYDDRQGVPSVNGHVLEYCPPCRHAPPAAGINGQWVRGYSCREGSAPPPPV